MHSQNGSEPGGLAQYFPLRSLHHDVPTDAEHVARLVESLRLQGQLQPILVRAGTNEVIDGCYRVEAARKLGEERVRKLVIGGEVPLPLCDSCEKPRRLMKVWAQLTPCDATWRTSLCDECRAAWTAQAESEGYTVWAEG